MICKDCGKDYDIGQWVFCPHEWLCERRPFKSWIDEGITDHPVEITSLAQWNRLMRENNCDIRDKMSRGDQEARKDRCHEIERERRHAS